MELTEIRYHPLIDGDSEGIEKIPMFLTTDEVTVSKVHSMYLAEVIPNYFRLHSKEPVSQKLSNQFRIHCPICGSPMKKIANNSTTTRLGLYTCKRCK